MSDALLFPGQGSQFVGMGQELVESFPVAAHLFEEADDLLGFSLSRLCREGPEEELTATRNAQPALFVHSLAVLRVIEAELGPLAFMAGHSLGEWTAHVAAGTLSFADGLRAVRLRGELMYRSGVERPGGMSAVLGLEDEVLESVCVALSTDDAVIVPANYNAPGQVVVSGDLERVTTAADALREAGARRVVPLRVSGAFHSPLMAESAEGLRGGLAGIDFSAPRVAVVSNVTAAPAASVEEIRELLVRQLTAPVRWSASIRAMAAGGVERFIEVGPGSVLSGLNRRNAPGTVSLSVGTPAEIEKLLG